MSQLGQLRKSAFESAAEDNYGLAADFVAEALKVGEFQPMDCSNLAFLAFNFCGRSSRIKLYQKLIASGLKGRQEAPALFLLLSFMLDLGDGDVERVIREQYLERILYPQIKVKLQKPIIFWHIPKCSGTSLNAALGEYFYRCPIKDILPGYTYKPLVKYLISEVLAEIPYFPSMHFSFDDIAPSGNAFSFAVLRDPVRRCLSMYRQEKTTFRRAGKGMVNWHHYRSLARYGAFWDYRRDEAFEDWLKNIPDWLLCRQLTTFSMRKDVGEALSRLRSLSYILARDFELGSEEKLFRMIGIDYVDGLISKSMNSSDKKEEVPPDAENYLRARLTVEYEMLDNLMRDF